MSVCVWVSVCLNASGCNSVRLEVVSRLCEACGGGIDVGVGYVMERGSL